MKPVALDADLQTWVIVWFVAAVYLLARHWRARGGVGLVLTYVMSFGAIHWMAPVMYLLPWYFAPGQELVAEGMKESALALIAFTVGGEFVAWLLRRKARREEPPTDAGDATAVDDPLAARPPNLQIDPLVVNVLLAVGVGLYFVVAPFAARMATLSALISSGSTLVIIGIGLKCWNAWQKDRHATVLAWLALSAGFPFVTVATQGFLGYGMAAMVTIGSFVAAFYGPRWKVLVAGGLVVYAGLSIYVTYMRDRADIRSVVWSGSTLGDRARKVTDTITDIEWFDIKNPDHLFRIDDRLNQNFLVGSAVAKLASGQIAYAHGETYRDAVLAIVPRAIWPNKPVAAGSGDLVSTYTGLTFMGDTSVGIGQVMETYVNFGTTGVVLAFVTIGAILILVDRKAYAALADGDPGRFLVWYMPGLSLLLMGGSFVEITSSAGASLVVALILQAIVRRLPPSTSPFGLEAFSSEPGPPERSR